MRSPSFHRRRLLIDCVAILGAHAVLLQVMAHTRIVERVMASQFNLGELLVIVAFFLVRFLTYFLVPPVVALVLCGAILDRLRRRGS